jgi:hypothetical protein
VNLEIFDGISLENLGLSLTEDMDVDDLRAQAAEALESQAVEMVETDSFGFCRTLALGFLDRVDWDEIADGIISGEM